MISISINNKAICTVMQQKFLHKTHCIIPFFFVVSVFFTITTQSIMLKQLGRRNFTPKEHKLVVFLANSAYSCNIIAEQFNYSVRTVYQILQNHKTRDTFEDLPRSGRPFKINNRAFRHLDRHIDTNRYQTLGEITHFLNTFLSLSVYKDTVSRTLNYHLGYHLCYAHKKPFLTASYIEK